jgi:DNA-directed RNA polymerase specialized sigma24 family protein
LRYFGGMTIAEVAAALGLGTTTVENHWSFAKAWLQDRLARA